MTCPYCHLVSSRYAEICAHCGASLRRVDTDSPHQLPLPFLPPAPQLPLPSTVAPLPRREIAPMPAPPRRVRVVRWNGVSITALLLGSACLGYGVRQIVLGSRAVLLAVVSSSDKGVTPSQAQTMPSFQNIAPPVQAPPAYMPGLAFPEPMPPLSALRPADRNDVPPFASLGGSPLRLQNINLVPRRTRLQITERYDEWKQSHGEGADEVGHYMAFYAPEARVFDTPGRQMSLSQLRALAIEVRNQGTYAKVLDQKPLQWGQSASGKRVELLAFHCYEDDGGNRVWGQRRLTWERRSGKWLIVRDDFPPDYSTAPLPKSKKPANKRQAPAVDSTAGAGLHSGF